MRFGNWEVSATSIEWQGGGLNRFSILKDEADRIRKHPDGRMFYEWVLLATDEDWITQNDLYDFNYAFVYAAAVFGLPFDYEIFDTTLTEQFEILDIEDEEDNW